MVCGHAVIVMRTVSIHCPIASSGIFFRHEFDITVVMARHKKLHCIRNYDIQASTHCDMRVLEMVTLVPSTLMSS